MSTKFKPSKQRKAEAVVDDWEAAASSSSDGDGGDDTVATHAPSTISLAATSGSGSRSVPAVVQNAWDDEEEEAGLYARNVAPSAQGKTLWEEANRAAPQAQPTILNNRSLPSTLLAPRIATASTASPGTTMTTTSEYDYRPPPQILRRDRRAEAEAAAAAAAALAAQGGDAKKKTLAQREEEYRKARERIFGTTTTTTATADAKTASSGTLSPPRSRNASGSDTGGRSSPATGASSKNERRKR